LVRDLNAKVAILGGRFRRGVGLAVEREMVIRPLAQQERLSTEAIQDAIGLGRSVKPQIRSGI
jgi:hypothetical protein